MYVCMTSWALVRSKNISPKCLLLLLPELWPQPGHRRRHGGRPWGQIRSPYLLLPIKINPYLILQDHTWLPRDLIDICTYNACMYVCMYVFMYLCLHGCMYVHMYVWMYLSMYSFIYELTYVCMYVYMYVCMYDCMYINKDIIIINKGVLV